MDGQSRSARSSSAARFLLILVGAAFLLLVGFGGGVAAMWVLGPDIKGLVATTQPQPTIADEQEIAIGEQLGLLEQIWDILQAEYISPEQINSQEMVHAAAAGFVSALGDPHTAFVEPVRAAIIEEDMQGSFEGIGATVEMREGVLTIVRPLPNSPAVRAGIEAGDQVLEVDGRSLEGLDIMEAITLIRGPRGTEVRLLLQREGIAEPFLVTVTRDRIEVQITEARMLEGDIAYLSLSEFNALSTQQVRADLRELMRQNPKGLVLDLRNNPGGYLQMAIEIASEFLPRGTLVVTEAERGEQNRELRATRGGQALQVPLAVLVNGGSASASEIVAGAIQDHGRGALVGEITFGKGSVQHTHTLSDGSSLRVTIARWVLPGGRILNGDGLEPDVVVSTTPDEVAEGRDVQLERAVEYLLQNQP
jgi:carboxyl-terminal processing protease